jgi:hypothetical protein
MAPCRVRHKVWNFVVLDESFQYIRHCCLQLLNKQDEIKKSYINDIRHVEPEQGCHIQYGS